MSGAPRTCMVTIARTASSSVVSRAVAKRCGSKVWSMMPMAAPSFSSQIVRISLPSIFMALEITLFAAQAKPGNFRGPQQENQSVPLIDYEWEYDNRGRVPEHEVIFAGMVRDSEAYRAASPKAELGISYGPSARQIINFFPAAATDAPIAVFIHGGYWSTRDPSSYSHFAKILNANGVSVAVVGYDLAPQVSIATIIEQMRAA